MSRLYEYIKIVESRARNWVRPGHGEEHDEVLYQLESDREHKFLPSHVRQYLTKLSDPDTFNKAVQDGKVRNVEASHSIGNTGDAWEDVAQESPEKSQRVEKLFKDGSNLTTPIVLNHNKSGKKWLLAGHHRLSYNSQIENQPTPVLHLDY